VEEAAVGAETVKIHHLNCATLCPLGGRLLPYFPRRVICHCLLIESGGGLILIDSGLGLEDVRAPWRRLGAGAALVRPCCIEDETALRQVERLGFKPEDVRHIVPTHLDFDHCGALPDFPHARVHVFFDELKAATNRSTSAERRRYRPCQLAHGPDWVVHDETDGEAWYGFGAVRALQDSHDEVLLVPLRGHTRGHCGVAVRTEDGWLLHAGDAYYDRAELFRQSPPRALRWFQDQVHHDAPTTRRNQARLAKLNREHAELTVFCSHDPDEMPSAGGV